MKKNMILGMALVLGILSVGATSSLAANLCCDNGKCADKQVVQQFSQETAALSDTLKAKDLELRGLYGYEGFDLRKADVLEAEIKDLKGKIKVAADKYGISSCCLS
ncbi:hypothetical protein KI809_02020 [Geobacter pelophilus]|uniref:Uncharacterized protein n=1 Tax=Geoanaerobacter pelophilus TaxID=60036 RepID=A0AAW4KWI6_9BACT|nr:hypothetical protein [Geoanaerobacter pelophilus]MBT0663064.1 hypothetical protein [Geoanaerobacter pelophilus]